VAAYGALTLLPGAHLPSWLGEPAAATAAALGIAGAALLLLACADRAAVRRAGRILAAVAAATGATVVTDAPATAVATLLAGASIGLLGTRPADLRIISALSGSAALIALLAPPDWTAGAVLTTGGVASPAVAAAVLVLAGGTLVTPADRSAGSHPTVTPEPDAPEPDGDPLDRPGFADALLESMNEAVMVLDANYRVLDVNRRWRELTGHRAEDAVGQQPPYAWAPDAGSGDRLLQRVDGTGVPVLATMAAVPDADGRPHAYVATYVDIGDRKRAEEALAERAEELERSNAGLREANDRLESALAFKNDLMSMLSHDMAQPVSSIASLSELLTSDWADLDEDIRLELATKIDRNTNRLIRMMNDLSLLFRLDTGSVTARRTPVPVREVVESVTAELDAAEVEIVADAGLSALVDRQHLWHVTRNLLSNAVTYGAAPVEVLARREQDRVVLVVQDRGPGIPANLVPKLFDRFMRGAGLGLFIVRHLVEANGGSVRYEQVEPQGARLVVELEADTAR
jgi:signal transduction histidine kinase